MMVRPHHFRPNPQTAADNAFQIAVHGLRAGQLAARAKQEFDGAVQLLEAAGITVHVFDDCDDLTPDSVFPNNWISTHPDGRAALYPMAAPNRRGERRTDVLDLLRTRYAIDSVVDLSAFELAEHFLEGTGAMVLAEPEGVAYVCRSDRAHEVVLEQFCAEFGFRQFVFDATDAHGVSCYHTNVMLCIAEGYVLVGSSMVRDDVQRALLLESLASGGRDVIELTLEQVRAFAGNAIELRGHAGPVLAISSRGESALTPDQRACITQHAALLPIPVPTIELAGGSVRCMIAGIHVAPAEVR